MRPLVICHCKKRQSRFHQTEQLEDLNIFFCIFDFYDQTVVEKMKIMEQELDISNGHCADFNNITEKFSLAACTDIVKPNPHEQFFL